MGRHVEHGGVILALPMSLQGPYLDHPKWTVILDRRKKSQRGTAKLLLIDLAEITQGLPACNLVGILVPESSSSHIPWLNVGETTAPPDTNGYLTPGGSTIRGRS